MTAPPSPPWLDLSPRSQVAIAVGKMVGAASRRLGRGAGAALPGLIALGLCPDLLPRLAGQLSQGCLLVTGTNGKTTTARLIASALGQSGLVPVSNRTGSHLLRGIASTLLSRAPLGDRRSNSNGTIGLFEVDEAVLPQAAAQLRPRAIVFLNLFRDQLDRYGEIDYVASRWRQALETLPPETRVILNADDPRVAHLGRDLGSSVVYYGIDAPEAALATPDHAADSLGCPRCDADLVFSQSFLGHLGHYACPNCGFGRPAPQVTARKIEYTNDGADLQIATPQGELNLHLGLPGVYNVYNALAALSLGLALDLPLPAIKAGLAGTTAAFGRAESVAVGDKTLLLLLAKNPVGLNAVLRTMPPGESFPLLLALNDNIADGRDVSWIWDVDFETQLNPNRWHLASGSRAADLALRLQYAGLPPEKLILEPDLEKALRQGLALTPPGGRLYVLPTYTAMLSIQEILTRWRLLPPYWEREAS